MGLATVAIVATVLALLSSDMAQPVLPAPDVSQNTTVETDRMSPDFDESHKTETDADTTLPIDDSTSSTVKPENTSANQSNTDTRPVPYDETKPSSTSASTTPTSTTQSGTVQ